MFLSFIQSLWLFVSVFCLQDQAAEKHTGGQSYDRY